MKSDEVIKRLFDLLEKLIGSSNDDRIAAIEAKLAEMESVWPQIKENSNGAN
jgi:hypothetical protein